MTSIRSDYDLMSRVYRLLHVDAGFELGLIVSGAHLSPLHGLTVERIRADGFNVAAEIETLISADTGSGRLKTASNLLAASIDFVRAYAPDALLYAGDREDVLIGAMLGAFLDIPTVHFFGGDHASDGHVDNPVRHATSKLSSLHLVSLESHARRLRSLGEAEHRIAVIGSVALDKFVAEPPRSKSEVLFEMNAKPSASQLPLAILIFHPIDAERAVAGRYVREATQALTAAGFHVCIGAPNADPGHHDLLQTLNVLGHDSHVTVYGNLSRGGFVNLMRHASLMVGNSSAGLLEAASVQLPVINIGMRQRGRECGANVVFCDDGAESFRNALSVVQSAEFARTMSTLVNPYGDGRSSERAVELLRSVDLRALTRKFEDPLHV